MVLSWPPDPTAATPKTWSSMFLSGSDPSTVASSSTWSWMLNSEAGVVNTFLGSLGLGSVNWLTSPDWSLASVIIANVWIGIPFNLVLLYSGLQGIPPQIYEAAALDGATERRLV